MPVNAPLPAPAAGAAGLHPFLLERENSYSLAQVASLCGVAYSTAHQWVKAGVRCHRMATFVVGHRRYVTRQALRDFLDAIQGGGAGA